MSEVSLCLQNCFGAASLPEGSYARSCAPKCYTCSSISSTCNPSAYVPRRWVTLPVFGAACIKHMLMTICASIIFLLLSLMNICFDSPPDACQLHDYRLIINSHSKFILFRFGYMRDSRRTVRTSHVTSTLGRHYNTHSHSRNTHSAIHSFITPRVPQKWGAAAAAAA